MSNRGVKFAWVLVLVYNLALLAFHLGTGHWWWAGINAVAVGFSLVGCYFAWMKE